MNSKILLFISALLSQALAVTYYVEASPVSPYSCTITRPCRLADLPATYTLADTVIFVPATTGSSSIFNTGSKTFVNPSIVLSPGITFNAFTLNAQFGTSLTCTATVNFQGSSSLATISVGTVSLDGCNFASSQFVTKKSASTTFKNAAVSGMSGTKKIQVAGDVVLVDTVSFSSGSTTVPALDVQTGDNDGVFTLNDVTMNSVVTSSGVSAILIQSLLGKAFGAATSGVTFTSCNSGAGLIETKIGTNSNQNAFSCGVDLQGTTANSCSVNKGVFFFNNAQFKGTIDAIVALSESNTVNFNNGAVFHLNAANAAVSVTANENNNNFCNCASENHFAICTGTGANANIIANGNVEGATSTLDCGSTTIVNMGSSC